MKGGQIGEIDLQEVPMVGVPALIKQDQAAYPAAESNEIGQSAYSHHAWGLKDEFEQFWQCVYPQSAETFLMGWMTAAV